MSGTDPHSLCAMTLLSQVGGEGLQPRSIVPLITQLLWTRHTTGVLLAFGIKRRVAFAAIFTEV